jgi:hypothetical protein
VDQASPAYGRLGRLPPQSFFGVSAVYLGPSLAVLLLARLDVLGVARLTAAVTAAPSYCASFLPSRTSQA